MRDPLLRTVYRHDLVCFQCNTVAFLIPLLHSFNQFRNINQCILIILRPFCRLYDCIHYMLCRREIGRSYREIINLSSLFFGFGFLVVQNLKDTGFIVLHAICKLYHLLLLLCLCIILCDCKQPFMLHKLRLPGAENQCILPPHRPVP